MAVGNAVRSGHPSDLWGAGTTYAADVSAQFWEGGHDTWFMVTVSVAQRVVKAYADGSFIGSGTLVAPMPRMLRQNNYVGAAHNAPFQHKTGGISVAVNAFRLYDRSLSSHEVASLATNPAASCCIYTGIHDAYNLGSVDATAHFMDAPSDPSAIGFEFDGNEAATTANMPDTSDQAEVGTLNVDICQAADVVAMAETKGSIRDGIGPYSHLLNCALMLQGFQGSTIVLSFSEFETEQGADVLYVHDGPSGESELLGQFSGAQLPPTVTSTGSTMYVRFASDANTNGAGFVADFAVLGTPVEYWAPSDVATVLIVGISSEEMTLADTQSACVGAILASASCCADATSSCANSRVTEIALDKASLRGTIPDRIGELGALRSLKLNSNFLTGALPGSLSRLHWLQQLQLSDNQFAMARQSLASIVGGLQGLRTLDIGMSDESPDLGKTILSPASPLSCRVAEPCHMEVVTRTSSGLQVPHGGLRLQIVKTNAEEVCHCEDNLDGRYFCMLPQSWTTVQGLFEFTLIADEEEFVPVRSTLDPATGLAQVVNSYPVLAVSVAPLLCQDPNSHPDETGAQCQCATGFYRRDFDGGFACDRCAGGTMPAESGTRCETCGFGKFSTGQACISCAPGEKPNLAAAAIACERCDSDSISRDGSACTRCPAEFVADENRTTCICPPGTYNATGFASGHTVQCLGDLHSEALDVVTPLWCVPCNDLSCIDCSAEVPKLREGWAPAETDTVPSRSPWLLFQCPVQQACVNKQGQRCREGHTGMLCNVCEVGHGLEDGECQLCSDVSSSPVFLLVLAAVALLGGVHAYAKHVHRAEASGSSASSLQAQLTTANPLQGSGSYESVNTRQSLSTSTVQRTDDAYMLLRVLYQPVRILVGYIQVVSQIGLCT
jgi:hypothetical protein